MATRRIARNLANEIVTKARQRVLEHALAVLEDEATTFMTPEGARAWAQAIVRFYGNEDSNMQEEEVNA